MKLVAIGSDDSRTFLSPVLQRVQAVVRQFSGVWMIVNAEDTAIMFGIVLHRIRKSRPLFPSKYHTISVSTQARFWSARLRSCESFCRVFHDIARAIEFHQRS